MKRVMIIFTLTALCIASTLFIPPVDNPKNYHTIHEEYIPTQETIDAAAEQAKQFHKQTKDLLNYHADEIAELSKYELSQGKDFIDFVGEYQGTRDLLKEYISDGYILTECSAVFYGYDDIDNPASGALHSFCRMVYTEQPEAVADKYFDDGCFVEKISDNLYFVLEKDVGCLYDIESYNAELNAQYAAKKQDN